MQHPRVQRVRQPHERNDLRVHSLLHSLVNPATQDFLFDPPTHDRVTTCHWAGILENNPKLVDDCAGNSAYERQLIDYCKNPKSSRPQEVHRAQKWLQKYWDRTKDDIAKPKGGIETIRIGNDVPK